MPAWIRLVAAAAVVVASLPASAPPVQAVDMPDLYTAADLRIKDFRQVLLDATNGQLFYRTMNEVLVTDLAGTKVRLFQNLRGGADMALSGDGTMLWVPLRTDHEIQRIMTADLTKAGRIALPGDICPTSVAETAGKLAVGHHCDGGDTRGVGTVDLDDNSWTDSTYHAVPRHRPLVVTSPGAPNLVVATSRDIRPAYITTYDVSSGDPQFVAGASYGGRISDLAINPAGKILVAAAGSPYVHQSFKLPDLTEWRTFQSDSYPNAAAWSGDGQTMVGGTDGSGANVWVFRPSGKKPEIVHQTKEPTAPRGIAVDHAGRYVWAVTPSHGRYQLHVLPGFGWGTCKGRPVNLIGTAGDDVIIGTGHDDAILAGAGNDTIRAGAGDDAICAQGGDDLILPGQGDDLVVGGGGRDTVSFAQKGSPSPPLVVDLTAGFAAGEGADVLQSIENVIGSYHDDTILGDHRANDLRGGSGSDYLEGLGANDKLSGGRGPDLLVGGDGNDVLAGQDGDDTLAGVAGNDILKGGDGDDTASFALSPNGVTASLAGKTATGEGTDTLKTMEWIVGTKHDDRLTGNGAANLIEARGGDDELEGLSNDDLLDGGAGFDALNGGTGDDACYDGESHSSCEFIGTLATLGDLRSVPFAGWAQVFLPRTRVR